jgi:hypothetical protein
MARDSKRCLHAVYVLIYFVQMVSCKSDVLTCTSALSFALSTSNKAACCFDCRVGLNFIKKHKLPQCSWHNGRDIEYLSIGLRSLFHSLVVPMLNLPYNPSTPRNKLSHLQMVESEAYIGSIEAHTLQVSFPSLWAATIIPSQCFPKRNAPYHTLISFHLLIMFV